MKILGNFYFWKFVNKYYVYDFSEEILSVIYITVILCTLICLLIWSTSIQHSWTFVTLSVDLVQAISINCLIENQLKFILFDAVLRQVDSFVGNIRRRRKQGIYSNSKLVKIYVKALSSILGIILANILDESSRQGFVLASMSQGLKSSSIIISSPKISKLCSLRLGSMR